MIAPIYHELSEKLERYIAENGITGKMPGVLKLSRELGVHHVTLSKAMRLLEKKGLLSINGTKGTFVTERTEKRPRHRVLALVGANTEQADSKELLAKLNEYSLESGYNVIGITFEEQLFQRNRRLLLNFPVDGFLFRMSSLRKEQAELLRRENIPIVSGARKEGYPWLDQTDCDHDAGYSMLLDRLIALGHRRIAHVTTFKGERFGDERAEAFLAEMAKRSLPVKTEWIYRDECFRSGGPLVPFLERLFSEQDRPTAVSCGNDLIALRVMTALERQGIRIPEEVSVIGYSDLSFGVACEPELTTIHQPFDRMGETAVKLALDGGEREVLIPTELVVRGSTASPC